jgi:hypothetical protein
VSPDPSLVQNSWYADAPQDQGRCQFRYPVRATEVFELLRGEPRSVFALDVATRVALDFDEIVRHRRE